MNYQIASNQKYESRRTEFPDSSELFDMIFLDVTLFNKIPVILFYD